MALVCLIFALFIEFGGSDYSIYRYSLAFLLTLFALAFPIGSALYLRFIIYNRQLRRRIAFPIVFMIWLIEFVLLVGLTDGFSGSGGIPGVAFFLGLIYAFKTLRFKETKEA